MDLIRRALSGSEPRLRSFYRKLLQPPPPNLEGDRYIEYSWVAAQVPAGPGQALDFGCGYSWMGLLAARRGYHVTAIDLRDISWPYFHAALDFSRCDLFELRDRLPSLDLIICCSTIEHVGLSDRYDAGRPRRQTDRDAMDLLHHLLKPAGIMLLTLPVGQDKDVVPFHRVYGEQRLPLLLERFDILQREFWVKSSENRWIIAEEQEALQQVPSMSYYGLGLFKLGQRC